MEPLGEIKSLRLADVFVGGEASDFTPWLWENLGRLAAELGFELESDDTEVKVGKFKADITAKATDGRLVVIENQFNSTDHSHLGQLLTYAAGLGADIIIWVSETIREEHRAAVDWLNEKAPSAEFYAVQARAIRIDAIQAVDSAVRGTNDRGQSGMAEYCYQPAKQESARRNLS